MALLMTCLHCKGPDIYVNLKCVAYSKKILYFLVHIKFKMSLQNFAFYCEGFPPFLKLFRTNWKILHRIFNLVTIISWKLPIFFMFIISQDLGKLILLSYIQLFFQARFTTKGAFLMKLYGNAKPVVVGCVILPKVLVLK